MSDKNFNVQGIYKITNNDNGKVYIGSSVNIKNRINSHFNQLYNNAHYNSELQKEWNIFGEDKFSYDICEIVENEFDLPFREKNYIDEYIKLNGVYNKSDPTEEFWQPRLRGEKKKGTVYDGEKTLRKSYIVGWLDGRFFTHLKDIKKKLKFNIIVPDNGFSDKIIENIDIEEITKDPRLNELINEWYRNNDIHLIDFPNYKKEFKQVFNQEIGLRGYFFVGYDTYEKLLKNRKWNFKELKEFQVSKKLKIDNSYKTKSKNKPKATVKSDKVMLQEEIHNKFGYLFDSMVEKVDNEDSKINYNKVSEFIYKEIKHPDRKLFENALSSYIRKTLKLSIYNLESLSYADETLNKFEVPERALTILNKETGKKLAEFNASLIPTKNS